MISFIKGTAHILKEGMIVLENNGIGYKINVSNRVFEHIYKNRENIKVFTFMNVKEDDISLFGFLSLEELEVFEKLISVSGVGPKGAISLLDVMKPQDIIMAIITSDVNLLSKGQGIGKKTAQRIALELKDKVSSIDAINQDTEEVIDEYYTDDIKETVEALTILGFTKQEIIKVINSLDNKNLSSDRMISLCLKKLSK